ncbi:MAG: GntR family transcriptional regulator [Planctomycetota bacterium]
MKLHVRRQIASGDWLTGDRLPSQSHIARHLGVSRHSVRRALGDLERDGTLEGAKYSSRRVAGVARPTMPVPSSASAAATEPGNANRLIARSIVHLCSRDVYRESHLRDSGFLIDADLMLQRVLRDRNVNSLCMPLSAMDELSATELAASRPRGLVLTPNAPTPPFVDKLVRDALSVGVRVVTSLTEGVPDACVTVCPDHEAGGRMIVDELARRGCRSVQRLWTHTTYDVRAWCHRRDAGVSERAAELGLELPPAIDAFAFPTRPTLDGDRRPYESGVRLLIGAIFKMVRGGTLPDAFVCSSDYAAMVLDQALSELGVPTEQRPLLAGYDNTWRSLLRLGWGQRPPAITVEKNNHEQGQQLALVVLDPEAGSKLIEPTLVLPENDPQPLT